MLAIRPLRHRQDWQWSACRSFDGLTTSSVRCGSDTEPGAFSRAAMRASHIENAIWVATLGATSTAHETAHDPRDRPQLRPSAPVSLQTGDGTVVAGNSNSLLATWQWFDRNLNLYTRASIGGLSSPFARPAGAGEVPVGFIGAHGEAVVIYREETKDRNGDFRLAAITARPSHSFGRPRPIAPWLLNCGLWTGDELELEPINTSPNGYAILYLTCEEGLHFRQYMIRYTP